MATARAGYARVPGTGLSVYYEEHGAGAPLVLLHGGFGSGASYAALLPALTVHRRVILVDLMGHGRTADVPDRPLRAELLADDVAALLRHLDAGPADLLGYSTGAWVALRTAIQHPELVRRLVLVSGLFSRDGLHAGTRTRMDGMSERDADAMRGTPEHAVYERLAPRPEDWPVLVRKTTELVQRDFDWASEVPSVTAPTLLVFGDADCVRPGHAVDFFALLGGGLLDPGPGPAPAAPEGPRSRLAILPGATHYDILTSASLPPAVIPFLYF
ncbi:alpha/beta fold hydrolase [Streptomyces bambusae]|uniref:alpha/beta fold hydrolase n=1 Tax=Streptomyces bambusae TaxID=1550616 RepID=UPI001CFD37E6|nr:alpha/beta hydrolase [Streptomyces bambusae]MCB5168515.1 alpha/beta fold hydrolase [Streptomyces bambusae]